MSSRSAAEMNATAATPDQGRTRRILGVPVTDASREEAMAALMAAIEAKRHLKVAFCNAHTANTAWEDTGFRRLLNRFIVFPDGIGVDIAARWLDGKPFRANLNGTDFIPALIAEAPHPLTIAMIGGRPGVASRAAAALQAIDHRHAVLPPLDGFAEEDAIAAWLADLKQAPADIILVAMGNPKQEFWIDARLDASHGSVAIGVGALFDFLAGEVARAPEAVRRLRLEWLWRLILEPKRLFRRYVLGNPLFLLRVLAAKFGLARP